MNQDCPEADLVCAIICQAVHDARSNPFAIKDLIVRDEIMYHKARAERWLKSNNEREMGFRWYCDLIGISPEWVRRKI